MLRREFLVSAAGIGAAGLGLTSAGCRSTQHARVLKPGEKGMVGSHAAGQETFTPLIDEAVGKLLARHETSPYRQVSTGGPEMLPPPKVRVCFVGVENCTAEEIGDFKSQIYERIDARLLECGTVTPISRRFVDAALFETRLRPEQVFIPQNMRMFVGILEQQGQPFDYLLFAKLTSGSTRENKDVQRDYDLVLELVNVQTGEQDKQIATISKAYHHSWTSKTISQWWSRK